MVEQAKVKWGWGSWAMLVASVVFAVLSQAEITDSATVANVNSVGAVVTAAVLGVVRAWQAVRLGGAYQDPGPDEV